MAEFNNQKTILIDGSYGEGGGQILRTALALAVVSGMPLEIVNIRKSRPKPGLQPQHLAAVKAAAKISRAFVEGAGLSSTRVRFMPREIEPRDYAFDVSETKSSAGSTSLVLQTVLLPLIFSGRGSSITLLGGTHVPWSPPFHYLLHVFLPMLFRLNMNVALSIEKWGWYPLGGGMIAAAVQPVNEPKAVAVNERGRLKGVKGISAVSNLPVDIAVRQRNQAIKVLSERGISADIEVLSAPSMGKGTFLFLSAEFENSTAGFSSLGAPGKRAEKVADEACAGLHEHLASSGAVDPFLADQIVPFLALVPGTSQFSTSRVTRHLLTNIWVVRQFLDIDIRVEGTEGESGLVTIAGLSGKR
jgi:RNA 3'-terminal phosphate cyclase (ATP)